MIQPIRLITLVMTVLLTTTVVITKHLNAETITVISTTANETESYNAFYREMKAKKQITEDDEKTLFSMIKSNPDYYQSKCDDDKIANLCALYSAYLSIEEQPKQAYNYALKAYGLGYRKAGGTIGYFQIKYPELFSKGEQLTINESLYYLEESAKAGSYDSINFLVKESIRSLTNKDIQISNDQIERYLQLAIKMNVKNSRFLLATFYTMHLNDESKIDTSIQLAKEDLSIEKSLQSSLFLMSIYSNSEKFPYRQDYIKGLAYAYITRDLRKEDPDNTTPRVEEKIIATMESELPQQTLDQANALYQQIKAEMDSEK